MLSKLSRNVGSMGRHLARPALGNGFQKRTLYMPAAQAEDSSPVIQRWWNGATPYVPYHKFYIDCSRHDMKRIFNAYNEAGELTADTNCNETDALRKEMEAVFEECGALQLKNTGFSSTVEFDAATRLLFPVAPKMYEGGANKRAKIEGNVYDVGAPGAADLSYHHEMAYIDHSVKWVSFGCMHSLPSDDGLRGCTYISHNGGVTDQLLTTNLGQKLKEKGLCYVRKLPDQKFFQDNNLDDRIVYNFWQTSMLTEDPDEAEAEARRQGLEVEWQESPMFGRYMVTKYYASCFEYNPYSDRNEVFASIADDYVWFQSWPGIAEMPHWERPLKLNFGDDEVMTKQEKQEFVDVFDNHGIPLLWEQGDVGILCNWRYAHGRQGYTVGAGENRQLGVILGEEFTRVGPLAGKWK